MNATQHQAIEQHGRQLLAIFPNSAERDPVKLCKKLRRLEAIGSRIALNYCNGYTTEEQYKTDKEVLIDRVKDLLFGIGPENVPIFLNGDPRGYALKIDDEWLRDQCQHNQLPIGYALRALEKDWGGYGILAPEIK